MYDSEIQINAGSSIAIGNNVTFHAKNGDCKVSVYGDISICSNVQFIAEDGADLELILYNNSIQVNFDYTTFYNAELISYAQNLTISNSEFDDCYIVYSHRGIVTVTETDFDRTCLYLENTEDNGNTAKVTNCTFTTDLTMAAIDLWNYDNFLIAGNTIEGYYNGLQIMQSGYGNARDQMIKDNAITNCTQKGILVYGSQGEIFRNHISSNHYGVWSADHSSISLYGYPVSETNAQTQEITNNDSYEVYASQYSFPGNFHYNVIIDEDNTGAPTDPMIYYSTISEPSIQDVRYNCWGTNFDPEEDFYPGGFVWNPTWCPSGEGGGQEEAEAMYASASAMVSEEEYPEATETYKNLVDQYPQSEYAKAAMNDLFALAQFTGSDYAGLKNYYSTNSAVQSDSVLAETGEHLATRCDIKLENWSPAIEYYENIILNPESMEDSIFAIINLGYIYFVMENSGYKSAYNGKFTQFKPESKEQFFENRDYLLSLLPGNQKSDQL